MIRPEIISASPEEREKIVGTVTEIERYALHDGFGIRSVVFMKGCPLKCKWCCNPETQKGYPEMAFFDDKCIGCGNCIKNCKYNAIEVEEVMETNSGVCEENCYGKYDEFYCTQFCYTQARKVIGDKMTVLDAFKEVERDMSFFDSTGGGLTISGGEPLYQPEFVYSLLRYSKENWVNTAIETCGAGASEDYKKIAPYLDLVFIDLKNMDSYLHKEWTGADNNHIKENIILLSKLAKEYNYKMYVRTPVIPTFNDTKESIEAIADFLKENCDGIEGAELLPYHKLGRGKYKSVNMVYELQDLQPPEDGLMEELNKILLNKGIQTFEF